MLPHLRLSKRGIARSWSERSIRVCGAIGILLIAEACSPAFADERYYANTCVEQESGDAAGYVVTVSDGEPRPSISLSWSEGKLMDPVAAKITDYDQRSGRVAFSAHIPWDEPGGRDILFVGKMESQRIEGIFTVPWENSPQRVELKLRSHKAAFNPDTKCARMD